MSSDQSSILGIAVRDIGRLRTIAGIIARHGFGEVLLRLPMGERLFGGKKLPERDPSLRGESAPERFTKLLGELGPTYIKLGQILSMRRDIFPTEWIDALESLQDDAPRLSFEEVKAQIEASLGAPLKERFAEFSEEPLATASIAQTHIAKTHDGEEVVVKVQRPGIEPMMRGDLDLLFILAQLLEAGIDELQLLGLTGIIEEFERGLLLELDFAKELENLITMRENLDPEKNIVVPRPFPELSSKQVLTMELFRGKAIRHLEPKSEEAKAAVEAILESGAKQVLIDRVFHGDPHSGNILINEEGTLCMIDLGMVGRLTERQRDDLVTVAMATILGDSATVARTLLRMGTPTERVNIEELRHEIERVRREYLMVGSLANVDSTAFAEEFANAAGKFRIRLAPEYAILVKAVATLEGIVRTLHPDVDIIGILEPTLRELVSARYAPGRILSDLTSEAAGLASAVRTLPTHLDQLLHDFETGNIRVRAVTPAMDEIPRMVHLGSGKIALALFGAATMIATVLVIPPPGSGFWAHLPATLLGLASAAAWLGTLIGHLLGRGKPLRLRPIIRLFRR